MLVQSQGIWLRLLKLTCIWLAFVSTMVTGQGPATGQEPSLPAPLGDYDGQISIPHIARYHSLPTRMEMRPLFIAPNDIYRIDPRLQPLFDRTLRESADPEFLEAAALSLARIAREEHGDISTSADVLIKP